MRHLVRCWIICGRINRARSRGYLLCSRQGYLTGPTLDRKRLRRLSWANGQRAPAAAQVACGGRRVQQRSRCCALLLSILLARARCFAGSRCAGRGGWPDRMAISPAPLARASGGQAPRIGLTTACIARYPSRAHGKAAGQWTSPGCPMHLSLTRGWPGSDGMHHHVCFPQRTLSNKVIPWSTRPGLRAAPTPYDAKVTMSKRLRGACGVRPDDGGG
jgi:hypothetical protein